MRKKFQPREMQMMSVILRILKEIKEFCRPDREKTEKWDTVYISYFYLIFCA